MTITGAVLLVLAGATISLYSAGKLPQNLHFAAKIGTAAGSIAGLGIGIAGLVLIFKKPPHEEIKNPGGQECEVPSSQLMTTPQTSLSTHPSLSLFSLPYFLISGGNWYPKGQKSVTCASSKFTTTSIVLMGHA
jgi:hypothetical protein